MAVNLFDRIEDEFKPVRCDSAEFIYDDMDSQSGRCLPIIYQSFDACSRSHWADRGSCFDYLYSTGGGRLLDFGPGDGWPSLIVAPFVDSVVGIEGSVKRRDVCSENAARLGISNAEFLHVPPGEGMPFEDGSFDGVMAATSVEQTPDPEATLHELYRVIRPGGKLRVNYEALAIYRGGREHDLWLDEIDDQRCRLVLYDRMIDDERVRQYCLTVEMPGSELIGRYSEIGSVLSFEQLAAVGLKGICEAIADVRLCELRHPSGPTLVTWLREAGFREVMPTQSGAQAAVRMFDQLTEAERPKDIDLIDQKLRPLVEAAVRMPAPIESDPMITAVK